jgi:hypothetical protein
VAIGQVQGTVQSADVRSIAVSHAGPVSKPSSPTEPPGEKVSISPQGDLLNKLNTLQHQDPVKFQEMAGDMAAKLRGAAMSSGEGSTGPLIRLADRLAAMAHSGATSSLRPEDPTPVAGAKPVSSAPRTYQLYHDVPEPRGIVSGPEKDAVAAALHEVNQALALGPATAAKPNR